jgi:hypothetical protein
MNIRIFIVTFVTVLFLLIASAYAQIGIKAGIGISDIAFLKDGQTPYLGYEVNSLRHRYPLLTFQIGTFGTIGLWKRIEFQPELILSMQGLNYSTKYLYNDYIFKINISYLKMPLLFRYKISIRKKWSSALFIGPYASWKLNAVRITEADGRRKKTEMPNVKQVDFGAIAGYCADICLPAGQLTVDLQFSYSLINMMNRIPGYIPWYYGPSKPYARLVGITLSMGYRWETSGFKNRIKQ